MFEVIVSNPRLSILSVVVTVLVLSGPGDHVIFGLGIPLAVQLKTTVLPSSLTRVASSIVLVIVAEPKSNTS